MAFPIKMISKVLVKVEDDQDVWERERLSQGQARGASKQNLEYLTKVRDALKEALNQVQFDVSSLKVNSGDTNAMSRSEFKQFKLVFIQERKHIFDKVYLNDLDYRDHLGKELVAEARKVLGYSDSYNVIDLWRSLMNLYQRTYDKE